MIFYCLNKYHDLFLLDGDSHFSKVNWDSREECFNLYLESFSKNGFDLEDSDRSIHSKHGLVVNLTSEPKPFEERNNKGAILHLDILRETVDEWVSSGFVKKLNQKPCYVNPMQVVRQENAVTKEVKFRPVIDMSRVINKLVTCEKTKLDDLSVVETLLLKDDFMTSFDLENMYLHARLHPDSVKYFRFCIPDIQGNPVYYQFLVMCFGYKRAVKVVTRLTKPLKAWIHDQGIRASLYMDNNLTMGQGYYECKFKFKLVLHVFQLA